MSYQRKQLAYNRLKQQRADNKGDWEFSFFQKKIIPNEEQKIKTSMRPENSFNPALIHDYINPQPKEGEILLEKNKTSVLKKAEQIKLANYLKKKNNDIETDMEAIKNHSFNAKPTTKEGKMKLLLLTLADQLRKKNIKNICNIYLRLNSDEYKDIKNNEFENEIKKMNEIIDTLDLIELQFTTFYNQMPPLNINGFKKFDPWQIDVINNIDNNISTIVSAPTSAGKTVLSGYATIKGKTLIVVPTDALTWQMAAYVGGILNCDVPVVTQTYQSSPKRDELIEKLNNARAIVGTAETLVDFLPLINKSFDWIIYDEIHMIGKPEGSAMELIIKIFDKVPFLALSATIGNIDEINKWFSTINPTRKIQNIICDKRFFNLQKFYYNANKNKLDMIHPFALLNINEIKDGSVLKKNLQPTPPDTWALYKKMKEVYWLDELDHIKYFDNKENVHLFKANEYFADLVEFLVANYDEEKIKFIINSFKNIEISEDSPNLVDLALLLKKESKAPAIIFHKNTLTILRIVREFAKSIVMKENEKNPSLYDERRKAHKKFEKISKKLENYVKPSNEPTGSKVPNNKGHVKKTDKKEQKDFLNSKKKDGDKEKKLVGSADKKDRLIEMKKKVEESDVIALQEPTSEFILNNDQHFTEGLVEEWVSELKKYFPSNGDEYHFLIKLLWRGVGVYAKGLPDPYLRLVQSLAGERKLGIVFSDMSLVFGVSMPFRTVVIYKDVYSEDDLDSMLYHQMSGRAGRRGLDKEGNIIFVGYNWNKIEELSICPIPNIIGTNTLNLCVPHANILSIIKENNQNWDNIYKNALNKESDEDNLEKLADIKSNYEGGWDFAIDVNDENHLHMMWKLRHAEGEAIIASFLILYLKRGFEGMDPKNQGNQIMIAHFLSHFINTKVAMRDENVLVPCVLLNQTPFSSIHDKLKDLEIYIPEKIDSLVFESIRLNKIVPTVTEKEADELRNRLFDFGDKIKAIQHYCFHSKLKNLSKLMGKLLTRIWWIYHTSSPIMKNFNEFDSIDYEIVDENCSNNYEDESDDDSSKKSEEFEEEAEEQEIQSDIPLTP